MSHQHWERNICWRAGRHQAFGQQFLVSKHQFYRLENCRCSFGVILSDSMIQGKSTTQFAPEYCAEVKPLGSDAGAQQFHLSVNGRLWYDGSVFQKFVPGGSRSLK